ncbi:MAG: endonuclease, partial [Clostridia bacterium]|nr:endonuclease [Clostridia bacterium]
MKKRLLSILLVLCLTATLFAGLGITASAGSVAAVDPTGYTKAEDVKYVKVGSYVCNWGARGEDCTFLSTYAQNYYTGNYTFEKMSGLSGSSTQASVPSSALYSALKNMMVAKKTSETSYNGTRELYKYTDCLKSDYAHISSFYSGKELNGAWDGGSTWNREHTWPNSKIDNNGENDIMMLRPTWVQENSHRGNKAYGESSSTYYFPNQEAGGKYDLRGDCARIVLYVYTRWGVTDKMWGSSGVMESKEILLKWMKEDPVDTWEMGRNDACQSIIGVRNVFVDYPEYAWLLFNESVPAGYTSPSSGSAPVAEYKVTAVSNNNAWGTASVSGNTITCKPTTGYYVADAKITSGTGTLSRNGNTITVNPTSDITVTVTFAKSETFTVSFILPDGVSKASLSGAAGSKVTLSAPSGKPTDTAHDYVFAGWLPTELADTTDEPASLLAPGTSYTLTGNVTFYAVYTYEVKSEGGDDETGDYIKVKTAPSDWSGTYVIVYEGSNYLFDSSLDTLDATNNFHAVGAIANETVAAEDGDPYKIVIEQTNGGYSILCSNGKYIGMTSSDNKILQGDTAYANTISLNENGGADIVSANCYFRYNKQSGQTRFRYYKASSYTSQQEVFLYRKDGSSAVSHWLTITGTPCEHIWNEGEITTPATCAQKGVMTYTCTVCGAEKTEPIAKSTDHVWDGGRPDDPPTCTEPGSVLYTCMLCEQTKYEPIEALGHNFVDGSCSRCGEEDPNYDPPTPVDPCELYTDIDRTSWYHNAADFVIDAGIMGSTSTEAKTFEPMT